MERDVRSESVRRDDFGLEEPRSVLREVVGAPGAFLDLGQGFADDLAHLPRHRRRVVVLVLSEDLREMRKEHASVLGIPFGPRPECITGPGDLGANLGGRRDRMARDHQTGRRIDDIERAISAGRARGDVLRLSLHLLFLQGSPRPPREIAFAGFRRGRNPALRDPRRKFKLRYSQSKRRVRGWPSLVKGAALRSLSRRGSQVQILPHASKTSDNVSGPKRWSLRSGPRVRAAT